MDDEILLAKKLLKGSDISILDAAKLIKVTIDFRDSNSNSKNSELEFATKLINTGIRNFVKKEISFKKCFEAYLKTKSNLSLSSQKDISYIGKRLIALNPNLAQKNLSEITLIEFKNWLSNTFKTNIQFDKARIIIHALYEYAIKKKFTDKNIIKLIKKKNV